MVRGLESFRSWFHGYEKQYAIIGGTACDLLMTDAGLDFRATKDIDLVLIVEAVDVAFGKRFWEYVKTAGYEHRIRSTGEPQFYRFQNPRSKDYPAMIELFTRKPEGRTQIEGVTVLDVPYLIPFKAKAWLDLSERKASGESVDNKNIRKHKNDVFRLSELLDRNQPPLRLPSPILRDMQTFTEKMKTDTVDLKQLGIRNKTKEELIEELLATYILED